MSLVTLSEGMDNHIRWMKARIAHLEAALTRIKTLADAPDPDPSGDRQLGLHCGLEDRGAQGDPHDACDYGYSEGVGRTMEWAVNEAEAGLKEKP